jgi:hypothetical protein
MLVHEHILGWSWHWSIWVVLCLLNLIGVSNWLHYIIPFATLAWCEALFFVLSSLKLFFRVFRVVLRLIFLIWIKKRSTKFRSIIEIIICGTYSAKNWLLRFLFLTSFVLVQFEPWGIFLLGQDKTLFTKWLPTFLRLWSLGPFRVCIIQWYWDTNLIL